MYFCAKCLLNVIFFIYSYLEDSSDEKKGIAFFLTPKSMKID